LAKPTNDPGAEGANIVFFLPVRRGAKISRREASGSIVA
jgi:hypothetical protein